MNAGGPGVSTSWRHRRRVPGLQGRRLRDMDVVDVVLGARRTQLAVASRGGGAAALQPAAGDDDGQHDQGRRDHGQRHSGRQHLVGEGRSTTTTRPGGGELDRTDVER